mmetsp:Transcript_1835/g.2784  ORF Transcript_1835/g.2784 Transcript_1835/m.2784 type:complete len:99 (-) Transcript_1835:28-324(-)
MGEYIFTGIPPAPAGYQKVIVCFKLNESGILTVSTKSLETGQSSQIEIRVKSLNLTMEERTSMALRREFNRRSSVRKSMKTGSRASTHGPITPNDDSA